MWFQERKPPQGRNHFDAGSRSQLGPDFQQQKLAESTWGRNLFFISDFFQKNNGLKKNPAFF
jgi:hypothetical protein